MDLGEVVGIGTKIHGVIPFAHARQFFERALQILGGRVHDEGGARSSGLRGGRRKERV